MAKATLFVPQAMARAVTLKQTIQKVQDQAAALRADYVSCGGDTMDGLAAYDFANLYGITLTEFQEGMLDLVTTHNAIGLSTIMTGNGFAKVVKLANGQ